MNSNRRAVVSRPRRVWRVGHHSDERRWAAIMQQ